MTVVLAACAVLVLLNSAFLAGYALGKHDNDSRPLLNPTVEQVAS